MIMQHQDNININTNSNSSSSTSSTTTTSNSTNNNCNASGKTTNASPNAANATGTNTNHSEPGKPKRNPYCSRCRNHGKIAQVKGHKRHCEYRDCQCEGCKLVECRQIVSAAQIKRRRYQKQDEECGRRIEVSPPVLTRSSNSDPATLIAKTLIGPTKHQQQQHEPAAQYLNTTGRLALDGGHLAASLASANPSPNLFQMPMWSALSPSVASAAAFTTMAQSWPSHHHHHHHQPQHHQPHQHQQTPQHHQSPQQHQQPPPAQPCQRHQVPLPSPHDQIHQVEELDQAFFAPLVIYAWLKAEHFDLQKIRNIIEMSKAPFDELIHTIIRKREHGQRESQIATTAASNEQQQQPQPPQQRPTFSDTLVASHQHARKFYPLPWNMF